MNTYTAILTISLVVPSTVMAEPPQTIDHCRIVGRVRWPESRALPKVRAVQLGEDKIDEADVDTASPLTYPTWTVDAATRGIKDVIVFVKSQGQDDDAARRLQSDSSYKEQFEALNGFAVDKINDHLQQEEAVVFVTPPVTIHKCRLSTANYAFAAGSPIVVVNSDQATTHVFRATNSADPKNDEVFTLQPRQAYFIGTEMYRSKEQGVNYTVGSLTHPWIIFHATSMPGHFSTQTLEDGRFELRNIPSGKVEIRIVYGTKFFNAKTGHRCRRSDVVEVIAGDDDLDLGDIEIHDIGL